MRVYCTSKNNGPSYKDASDVTMLYLGTSVHEAEKAVDEDMKVFAKESHEFPINFPNAYSAIPATMEREIIQFFTRDGWWYSIVMFDLV